MDAASISTARAPRRERRRHDAIVTSAWARRQVPTISPSTRTAPGQTRDVQSSPRRRIGDQQLPIGSLEQVVGVAARKQPRGRHGPPAGTERRLVAGQDPRVADRRPHRRQRIGEPIERGEATRRPDARPLREPGRRRRTEDVQVPTCELESRVAADRPPAAAPSRSSADGPPPTGSGPSRSQRRTAGCWG